jgi:antitoxin component HigA of HigAB toxin-antitoxin module
MPEHPDEKPSLAEFLPNNEVLPDVDPNLERSAAACEAIDRLSGLDLNPDQEEYLEALSLMVEDCEASLDLAVGADASPLETLRYLCAENGLSGAGLAEILGVSRTLGVKLLAGERKLTLAHAVKLAGRFKVSVELFAPVRPISQLRGFVRGINTGIETA